MHKKKKKRVRHVWLIIMTCMSWCSDGTTWECVCGRKTEKTEKGGESNKKKRDMGNPTFSMQRLRGDSCQHCSRSTSSSCPLPTSCPLRHPHMPRTWERVRVVAESGGCLHTCGLYCLLATARFWKAVFLRFWPWPVDKMALSNLVPPRPKLTVHQKGCVSYLLLYVYNWFGVGGGMP